MPQVGPHEVAGAYVGARRARVRVQLDNLDASILRETRKQQPDGQRLTWLAAAQERLAEQERVLDGRPLPGSRRPKKDDGPPGQSGAWFIETAP
jgi:hypothetical protein